MNDLERRRGRGRGKSWRNKIVKERDPPKKKKRK